VKSSAWLPEVSANVNDDSILEICDPGKWLSDICIDLDKDGYGRPASSVCKFPELDCNNNNPNINPAAKEICNNLDDNCNSIIDENCDKDNDNYCGAGMTIVGIPSTCTSGGNDCNDNNLNINPAAKEICANNIDDNCNAKTDCQDTDCSGSISGNVKDTGNKNVDNAKIEAMQNTISKHTAFTQPLGDYQIGNVLCGAYDMIASEPKYVSSAKTIDLIPNENKQNVDFTLVLGTTCEADCTYAGDNLIHKECNNINGCAFHDSIAADVCNLAQPGWVRDYPPDKEIECAEGSPAEKIVTKATVTCDEENLIKVTKLVMYKGKLLKLNVVVCG
ncbi:MAG: MopE-related protein, partial [Nanoarchaeota archaeon]